MEIIKVSNTVNSLYFIELCFFRKPIECKVTTFDKDTQHFFSWQKAIRRYSVRSCKIEENQLRRNYPYLCHATKNSSMKKNTITLMVITAVALTTGGCCNKANDKVAAESQTPQMTVEKAVTGTLLGRHSIRAYKAETVPQNIMDTILLCGINAPSGMNKQPWEIRVVNDQKCLEDLTKLQIEDMKADDPHNPANDPNLRNMFRNAPTVVFIAMKDGFTSQVDCGLLAGNMVNTAWAYGIGSCIQ